jgi:hypothetical protein
MFYYLLKNALNRGMSKSALKLTKAEHLIMGTLFLEKFSSFANKHRSTEENFSLPTAK